MAESTDDSWRLSACEERAEALAAELRHTQARLARAQEIVDMLFGQTKFNF